MKRLLLSIIMVVIGLSAFSQSPSRIISLQPAYPLIVGEKNVGSVIIDNNGVCLADTPLDSLPHYEIGQIFEQTVRCYTEEGHGFYVKADSLHSLNVVYSYELKEGSELPNGAIEFNATTGRFKYFPAEDDYKSFTVTFTATNGTETITEDVVFGLMPRTPSELTIFHSEGVLPDAGDYIVKAETSTTKYLNNQDRTAYSISISGKDVIFDDAVQNKVWGLSGREDIYELNIYAERLIIRSALKFPQTDITIYAKELIFEDNGGVIASINTSPSSEKTLTDGQGVNGENAGNITLNVKEVKSNMALRFVLNGADGQSTNRNGTPGNGGNGGTVTATVDVSNFCDLARGSAGIRYDVAGDGSTQQGPPVGYGQIGIEGCFVLTDNPHAYLHPYYLSAVMRHANDAFINNCTDYTLQTCREYHDLINEYLSNPNESSDDNLDDLLGSRSYSSDGEINLGLQKDLMEINNLLFRLEQGLDYFGNPDGWVPLLSFETYLASYDNEIDRAIPTLYMYYWLSRIDKTLQNQVQASEFAASTTEKEIDSNTELLNSLTLEIPVLQDEADALSAMIEDLTKRIETLQNQLLAQATKSVKRRHWLKNLFSIGSVVSKVVSFVPGWGTTVSSGLNLALNIASTGLDYSTGENYSSALNKINVDEMKDNYEEMMKNLTEAKTSISQKDFNNLFKACNSFLDKGKLLANNINNAYNVISNNKVSDSEVQAEYNKLIANSPEWNKMKSELEELNIKKTELINHMNEVFSNMTNTMSELSNDVLALDAFKRDVFIGNSKRDLNAMLYIEKMQQRAKKRLLKYDYYLRKAYEYRLLKPYGNEEFNLGSMFDRLQTVGLALDSVVDYTAYSTLSSVYKERVSDMTHKIIEEYTHNQPEKAADPIPIHISKEQLDEINANGSTTLNLYEMDNGTNFFLDEENIRIVKLGVSYVKAHAVGNATRSRLGLDMKHSGMSQYRKDGQIYWFDHMARNTTNPHFWRTTLSFNDKVEKIDPETHQESVAISSLLSEILNNNNDAIMLFSRPSAWSDITLSKMVNTNGDDIVIDSLVLTLQYDYTLRPDNIRNINITANNGLMPYIACSAEDINGRGSGRGPLYRSYRTSTQTVTFTAQDKYETYYFVNWTDQYGKVISDKAALTISRQKDQHYVANYERRVPILNIPDTIHVGNLAESRSVAVRNIGSGDTEMDWYVDKHDTWVHIKRDVEGLDDGAFTFTCDKNNTKKARVDSIEVFAPETDEMTRKIYIVQAKENSTEIEQCELNNSVQIYPNPMRDYVNVEGVGLLSVCINSLTGRELYRQRIGGEDSITIDVGTLPNGVYIITVESKEGFTSKKLLKANR